MADRDEAEAKHLMKLYGVKMPSESSEVVVAPSAKARQAAPVDMDASRLLQHYGVTLDGPVPDQDELARLSGGIVRKNTPREISNPPYGLPNPEALRMSRELGPVGPFVEGIPLVGPAIHHAAGAINALADTSTGDSFGDRYTRNMSLISEANRLYGEENPLTSMGANLAGGALSFGLGAATPAGKLVMGMPTKWTPGVGGQFYAGVGGGAATNALDAGLRGHDAGMGALFGAGTGMVAPVLNSLFTGAGRMIPNHLLNQPAALRDFNSIAREKLAEGMRGTPDGVGPHSFFGEQTPGLTKIAQGISFGPEAEAEAVIRNAYHQRAAEAPTRMNGYLDNAFGGPRHNILEDHKLITEERARLADPLYEKWRTMQVFPSQGLKDLVPRLEKAGAFNMAEEISGVSGREMYKNFFTTGPKKAYPTAEGWDFVKRGLDRRINQLLKAEGGGELARELLQLKGELLSEIRKTPAGQVWDQARDAFASKSALIDQLEAGRDTFVGGRAGTSVDELREELKHLSQPELMARINSARDVISEAMGESRRGATATRDKLLSDNGQKKLELLLGKSKTEELVAMLEHERQMGSSAEGKFKQVVHGSQTTSNTEAVNALKAPQVGDFWDPQFNRPITWIPGMRQLAHELQPSTVAQSAREVSYSNALHQMAPKLVMPNMHPDAIALRRAIMDDLVRRDTWSRGAARGAMGVNALIMQPAAETFRIQSSYKDKSPLSVMRAAN